MKKLSWNSWDVREKPDKFLNVRRKPSAVKKSRCFFLIGNGNCQIGKIGEFEKQSQRSQGNVTECENRSFVITSFFSKEKVYLKNFQKGLKLFLWLRAWLRLPSGVDEWRGWFAQYALLSRITPPHVQAAQLFLRNLKDRGNKLSRVSICYRRAAYATIRVSGTKLLDSTQDGLT